MHSVVQAIAASPVYRAALLFFALYPLFSSIMWIQTSLIFYFRQGTSSQRRASTICPEERCPSLASSSRPLVRS